MNKKLFDEHVAKFEQLQKLFEAQPDEYRFELASKCFALGFVCNQSKKFDEADKYYTLALENYRVLNAESNHKYDDMIASICYSLALVKRLSQGSRATAEKLYLEALGIYISKSHTDPAKYSPLASKTAKKLSVIYKEKSIEYRMLSDKMKASQSE